MSDCHLGLKSSEVESEEKYDAHTHEAEPSIIEGAACESDTKVVIGESSKDKEDRLTCPSSAEDYAFSVDEPTVGSNC